jgi:DNA-binding MarR family transcriptional regulator
MPLALGNVVDVCLALRSRRLARAISRAFDRALAATGLDSSQFNILTVVGALANGTLSDVARTLDLDRSTLSRLIRTLELKGLLAVDGGKGRGGLRLWLTPRGEDTMAQALEAWQTAQRQISALVGDAQVGSALNLFDRLERAARENEHRAP